MRSRFLLVPAAVVAISQPAAGFDLQSLEAAQQKLAPGAKLTPYDFKLTPEQVEQIKREYKVPVLRSQVTAWRVDRGGWLFLDQVFGLNDVITYLVSVGDDGAVRGIEVLVCQDGYCDIYSPQWRATYVGKSHGRWAPEEALPILSGATLSTTHVAEGVKKLLAIHARFMPAAK
jgi:hypothetical protein